MSNKEKVIVRFPPSPTGYFHIGSARTALFNFLFARKNDGKIFLRIEDTDIERSKKEYEEDIIKNLKWLGINFDNEDNIIYQSKRTEIYEKYLKKMVEEGKAYVSKENPEEDFKRAEVIRFKNPNAKIKFHDIIRGDIEFDTTELGDFVIAKSFHEPLYHLAVVIDDFEMGVNYVIRGEDHISNTPRQILLQEAIGAPRPNYAHIPLILAPDRSKLSKRYGAVSISEYREQGYLPEAIVNYLALLGWNPGTDKEIFSLEELINEFSLERIQKSGAIFDINKLNWMNKEYMKMNKEKSLKEIYEKLKNYFSEEISRKLTEEMLERINKFGDIDDLVRGGELSYFLEDPKLDKKEVLIWKDLQGKKEANFLTKQYLETIVNILEKIPENEFTKEKIKEKVWPFAEKEGRGNILWPMRYSLSGKEKSPDPFVLAFILGKDITIKRLRNAIKFLE